jgi:hypothetical protein
VREAAADDGVDGGSNAVHAESVFCVLPTYLALSYKASEICKLSRKLPADFQELPLPAVTGLVVGCYEKYGVFGKHPKTPYFS